VGEAVAADRALAKALNSLETSEQTLEKLRLKNFQNQLRTFKEDVARVASRKDQTIEQAAQQLKAKAAPVVVARRQLSAAVKCEEPAAAKP
jgi:DNA-binding ferritin-like protein